MQTETKHTFLWWVASIYTAVAGWLNVILAWMYWDWAGVFVRLFTEPLTLLLVPLKVFIDYGTMADIVLIWIIPAVLWGLVRVEASRAKRRKNAVEIKERVEGYHFHVAKRRREDTPPTETLFWLACCEHQAEHEIITARENGYECAWTIKCNQKLGDNHRPSEECGACGFGRC